MTSSSCKKKKASPFSKEEELRLVEKIYEERKFIENKETNKVSNTAKEMAWVRICDSFNTNTLEFRGVDQLKSKYDNIKTKTRKQVAKEKKYEKGTGGGFFIPTMDDPVMDMILKIVNAKTVVGLTNPNDDDHANETILEKMDEDLRKDSDVSLIEPPLLIEEMKVVLAEELPSEEVQIAKPWCHQKTPSKKILTEKTNPPGCSRNVASEKVTNWADYNPYKLKQSLSKKLRPVMQSSLGDAKENYYKVMAETMKDELELKKNKDVREHEIHELEKRKKNIEIELLKLELLRKQIQ